MTKFVIIILMFFAVGAVIAAFLISAASNSTINNQTTAKMLLTSPSFENSGNVPVKFTCDGGDINPEFHIQNAPPNAQSLALIMDDPDATGGRTFTHWLLWNISSEATVIKQESIPPGAMEGTNDFPRLGYGGPCPPRGSAPHHYHFKLYALDEKLGLPSGSDKSDLEAEIKKHILAQTELVGLYARK